MIWSNERVGRSGHWISLSLLHYYILHRLASNLYAEINYRLSAVVRLVDYTTFSFFRQVYWEWIQELVRLKKTRTLKGCCPLTEELGLLRKYFVGWGFELFHDNKVILTRMKLKSFMKDLCLSMVRERFIRI